MLKSLLVASAMILCGLIGGSRLMAATLYTYTSGGNNGFWNVAGTWTTDPSGLSLTGSAVPGNNDIVIILNGFTVNLNANVSTTGLAITINNGGVLDLATFSMPTISSLSGAGTLKLGSANFPTITTNNFVASAAAGATVEYYDFSGNLPVSINYPNLSFTNKTGVNHIVNFSNTSGYSFTIFRNLITQVTGAGTLTVNFGTQNGNNINLAVNGNITIGANTRLGVGFFNSIHALTISGNLTNNGTIDFSNSGQFSSSSNGAANVTFVGATDNNFVCNGITDLYTLTVDKGLSSTNILSVTSNNVANLNFYSNGQLIMIQNGTLRLGANINIPRLSGGGNYNLGDVIPRPMLWIDGADVNTNGSALVVYGKFRITAGSFTVPSGEGSVIREEGQYIIEGGTFTTPKFRPSNTATTHRGSFIMSGGTFNAQGTSSNAAYARFSHPYPEQVFIMSGGTINVSNGGTNSPGGIHIGCSPSNYSVTGGTFNAIISDNNPFNIASTAPFWNLNISKTGGLATTVRLLGIGSVTGTIQDAQPLAVLNDFTIEGANNPVFNANGSDVFLGRNFTINNGGTYTPTTNTTTFNGTGEQNFVNNGTITTGLNNLTVNKPSGAVVLSGSAASFTVTQLLTLSSGILNDGGKIIQVAGNIHNEATHTGTGSITLNGTSTQTLSGNGSGIYGNLILNNNSVPGARTTSDMTVSGVLTLAGTGNSLFDIDQNRLSLSSNSATALTTTGNPFSSTKMIRTLGLQSDGGIRKSFGNLSPFIYAFGAGTSYTPATIQLTAAPTTYGTITARPVETRHPFVVTGNTNNLNWYWKVGSNGFTGLGATAVTHAYQYVESSVSPAGDDVNYIPARYSPTAWTVISDLTQVNETSNIISFSNVGYIDGEFTAGVPAAFGLVRVFYSKRSGNWTNVSPGTTPWSLESHTGADAASFPVVGDNVYIGDGTSNNHTITITDNNQASGGLEINVGSVLDVGVSTGHNFGTFENSQITGSGVLRVSSSTATAEFPAGDFGNFIRTNGGTVEYYTTGAQDFTIPLNSSAPTTLPLISYRHLTLTPGTGRFIQMPNQDIRLYGNMAVQGTTATSIVRLNSGASRSLNIDGNLLVASGNLHFQNGTAQNLEIVGNITVNTGAIFDILGSGTAVVNTLTTQGNLINNGVFDMANGTRICNTSFEGAANRSITGTGATTEFNTLTVSKGTSQASILNVNASAFSLSSATNPLVLTNGTFRLSSAQTVTFANGSDFNIPTTARLSANGGTLQLTGGNGVDLLLSGTLEVLNGTINIGTTANDNSIEYAATGQPTLTVSGGSLNVRSQVRRSFASTQGALTYNQSGTGTVSVGISSVSTPSRGVFEILNAGSSFNMSGGTLSIARELSTSTISELYLQPTSNTVTGGTIEIGTGQTSQTIDINSTIPVFNVTVAGTTNTARLEFTGLTLRGSLTIQGSNVFNANSFNVNVAGNFTNLNPNNGTVITAGGYRAGAVSQTTTLNGTTGNQSIVGDLGNLTNFGNLVINNTFAGGTVTLQPNTNLRVHGTLTLSNGTVAVGANTISALNTVSNSTTQTNTTGSITLLGTSNQLITGNGNGRFGNLVLNNTSGARFGANQEITGTLTFTNGVLNIGAFRLNLSNTSLGTIVGATPTRYIITSGNLSDAGVTKAFAANETNGNFIYPIGVGGKYTPANYTLSTGAIGGTITIRPVNSKHPSATGSGTAFINYYWSVNNSVIVLNSLTHTYTYVAADQEGIVADYRDARFQGGAWNIGIIAGNPNITTRVITFTNTDVQGDYTCGEPTAFVNPTTYTSIASGSWESDVSVWDIDPPGTNLGPPAGSFVIISPGHTVTVTGNAKRLATLGIRGRLHLGTTSGHDFGTVSTSGAGARTLQIQSSVFPTGNFTNFNAANGGTVEYNGAVTVPTQSTYNNLTFTGAGLKTLPNADLTINGNFSILGGTVTNATNNRTIILVNNTGDFTNNGGFTLGTGVLVVGRDLINTGAGATFTGGDGTFGLQVARNLVNSAGATFIAGTDNIEVQAALNNSATFTANSGDILVGGNFNNTGGSFTGSSGIVAVDGSLTNNATYSAGTGATTVLGSYINSGASAIHNANLNALTVAGNVTLENGSTFNANSGTLSVGGDWNNSSTFNRGSSTVSFNSATAQTLTGSTNFHNLVHTNGGSLTLNNNLSVANTLTLTSGNIITGTNTVSLTNSTAQPITGFSASSFIDGRLATSFPDAAGTSRIFPVGKGSVYRPVTIQQTGASTSPVVRVEMINTQPSGTYPIEVGVLSEARYYAIDLISGTINSPTVELNFNTNGSVDENVLTPGNARVLRSTAPTGPWTNEGGSGVITVDPAGYATSGITSINNPTYFTLGYQNVPQPITLKSFDAVLVNGVVQLKWTTSSEKDNDYFTIERSGSELQFDSISFVEGAGTSNVEKHYRETDDNPLSGVSYYRLKQTDYDLKTSYSKVIRIVNSHIGNKVLSLYPNPASLSDPVFFKLDNNPDKESYVVITNVTGRVFYAGMVDLSSKIDINELNLNFSLEQGVYFVTVSSGSFRTTKKVIIQ